MRMRVSRLLALADDLVAGGMGNEVGEPLHGHACRRPGWSRPPPRRATESATWSLSNICSFARDSYLRGMPATVKWPAGGMGFEMPSNARTVRIEWGDCDPAGIVFYPRYFAMFDHSHHLADRADAGHEQASAAGGPWVRRLSDGGEPGALPLADAVRRRRGDRDQHRGGAPLELRSHPPAEPATARSRSRASRPGYGRCATRPGRAASRRSRSRRNSLRG